MLSCSVVRDLLPAYLEKLTGEGPQAWSKASERASREE